MAFYTNIIHVGEQTGEQIKIKVMFTLVFSSLFILGKLKSEPFFQQHLVSHLHKRTLSHLGVSQFNHTLQLVGDEHLSAINHRALAAAIDCIFIHMFFLLIFSLAP